MQTDVTIIGGGIVGLATARALVDEEGLESVCILEKEPAIARHQSTNNSGVLHAGLQYTPGSEKARLARDGIRRMTEYCRHHAIPHEICGKLVLAHDDSELPRLEDMLERGRRNGLQGLRRLSADEAKEIEPHVQCVAAIHVPEEGIVSFEAVCQQLAHDARALGVEIHTDAGVHGIRRNPEGWQIATSSGDVSTKVVVNCAGLFTDRVAKLAGERPESRVVPFRGEYQRLRREREHLVRHLVYPLPEPGFPFLGVHFTRRIDEGIDAGPNAVLAFAREGYRLRTVSPRDLSDALLFSGLWRFVFRHRRMITRELAQSMSRRRFLAALQRLIPEIEDGDVVAGGAGVRAQAMLPSGDFVHDFSWIERPGAVHVLNAPSPAATASLAIGSEIASRAKAALGRPKH
jgi:L-2-hydroxyglutarate oxidase